MSVYELKRPWLWLSDYAVVDEIGNDLSVLAGIWPNMSDEFYHVDDDYRPSARKLAESYEPRVDDRNGVYWMKTIRWTQRTARRNHADGKIRKGDRYTEYIERWINDETGESQHERRCVRGWWSYIA